MKRSDAHASAMPRMPATSPISGGPARKPPQPAVATAALPIPRAAPGGRLILDPDGAWTTAQATALLPRFAGLGVEAVEQPLAPGDPDAVDPGTGAPAEVARQLSLSQKTVANYGTQIKRKLNVHSTGELVHLAIRNGVVKGSSPE